MKQIPLTQGKVALVDDADFEELNQWKWYAVWDGWHWYAIRCEQNGGRKQTIYMHRQIMGAARDQQIDHRNRTGLDNQRGNLRFCTTGQNAMNRKKRAGCSSRYKGVTWYKLYGKWMAYIKRRGKQTTLGYFDEELDAALAYNEAATEYFGEFARLNAIEV